MIENTTYQNPVIQGFYPDPSIVRVEDDFYLCTSTFEFYPGVPVFHSKNLVNWQQIGHCLTRQSQLPIDNAPVSTGILAPTIRYNDGKFYMITTNMTQLIKGKKGNFIVQSSNPSGPWSEPIWIDHEGIDPSLLFDKGKVYYCGTGFDENGQAIILFEVNPDTGEVLSEKKSISYGCAGKCAEAPHIYKINGYYYLILAEGGTEYGHMITVQRAKDIWGPYETCPTNPFLTHRNINGGDIQCIGHADMVEDQNGNWWMVCLGVRPTGPMLHNLGRETFLLPIEWKDGWPYHCESTVSLEMSGPLPAPLENKSRKFHTDFDEEKLDFDFNYLRNPVEENYLLDSKNSRMILKGSEKGLTGGKHSPTFMGIRQKDFTTSTTVKMDLDLVKGTKAGLTAYHMDTHHYDIEVFAKEDGYYVQLNKSIYDLECVVNSVKVEGKAIYLRIESDKENYYFSYSMDGENFVNIGKGMVAALCTEITEVMTFTGTYIGIFAQNGEAKFDFFNCEWNDALSSRNTASMYPDQV